MTPGLFLIVALAGGAGAAARFLVDGLVMSRAARRGRDFPWGILLVNASGSLLLGLLVGLAESSLLDAPWLSVLGIGLLGGYTTFSTAMVDTVRLAERGRRAAAVANGAGMLVLTVALAVAGALLGRAL